MIRVRFVTVAGTIEVEAVEGTRLLALAQGCGLPLEGTCGGAMACATCHVVIDPADAPRLPPPVVEEEDMLDFAPAATRTSRLSCQIVLDPACDGMIVRLPSGGEQGSDPDAPTTRGSAIVHRDRRMTVHVPPHRRIV